MQRKITNKEITLRRIPGVDIVADIGTKHLVEKEMKKIIGNLGFYYCDCRSDKALRAELS